MARSWRRGRPGGPHAWSLDPIDGTRAFICGMPSWTTLIALLEEGAPVVGLIDAPRLDERYVGTGDEAWLVAPGGPAAARGQRLRDAVARRDCRRPIPISSAARRPTASSGCGESARVTRYGHDAYAYARLAAGTIDLVAESGLSPHDLQRAGAGGQGRGRHDRQLARRRRSRRRPGPRGGKPEPFRRRRCAMLQV